MSAPARRGSSTRSRTPRPTPRPVAYHDDAPREGTRVFSDGSVAPVLRTSFDVSAYTIEVPGKIDVDAEEIARTARELTADPHGIGARDLEDLRRDLAFLHSLESTALTETRTMYSSWTANEARITAFLASWLWERHWWAHALQEIVEALPGGGHDADRLHLPHPRLPHPHLPHAAAALRHAYVERALPIVGPGWTWLAGEKVTAGHMARMAIQEGGLRAAVDALLPRAAQVPEAGRVLGELLARRTRTMEFFRLEAIARITRSRGEAIAARAVLAVGGDPMRPAGQHLPGEETVLPSIFRRASDRAALRSARFEITRLLPGPDLHGLLGPARAIRRGVGRAGGVVAHAGGVVAQAGGAVAHAGGAVAHAGGAVAQKDAGIVQQGVGRADGGADGIRP
ncbi:hypothetical protein [Brachybacterium sp. ACRRE]|uniref:hypothetical protein n=1 Tax=Brachybacterium sp. ACRRE TaxID=2918184 RepID=UPI001EF263C4|nr:hypothetical protein [Brachybacterium sp. ACRRE]MCG7309388.1 hypothetical protein [Brachybacterium sp. ACRRE]